MTVVGEGKTASGGKPNGHVIAPTVSTELATSETTIAELLKGTVAEGGLRVPFIIRRPGIQAGACSQVQATGVDLLA